MDENHEAIEKLTTTGCLIRRPRFRDTWRLIITIAMAANRPEERRLSRSIQLPEAKAIGLSLVRRS